jgi:hypothetical protein
MCNAQGKVAVKSFPRALGYTGKALMLLAIGSTARTALSEPYPLTGVEMGCNVFIMAACMLVNSQAASHKLLIPRLLICSTPRAVKYRVRILVDWPRSISLQSK